MVYRAFTMGNSSGDELLRFWNPEFTRGVTVTMMMT